MIRHDGTFMYLADGQVVDFAPIIWRQPDDPPPPGAAVPVLLYEPGDDEPLLELAECSPFGRAEPEWRLVGGVPLNGADVLRWAYAPRPPAVMPGEPLEVAA